MRSHQLILEQYKSDKIASHYFERYDPILEPWVNKEIKLLEIGVLNGGSLLLWRDYFSHGTIVGIDVRLPKDFGSEERIHLFKGSQANTGFLSEVANKIAPEGFDIIIDDASHIGELTKKAFWHLFDNHLKPGGLYVIEDWGTGYWQDWPDGMSAIKQNRSFLYSAWSWLISRLNGARKLPMKTPFPCHSYGMVGFLKELVDEQGAADLTRAHLKGKSTRQSRFESLLIVPSIVFVRKATSQT